MSDSNQTDSTTTVKSSPERQTPGLGRYALNFNVLVMRLHELLAEFVYLTSPLDPQWLTPEELRELRRLWNLSEQAYEWAKLLERSWKARQGLSPRS